MKRIIQTMRDIMAEIDSAPIDMEEWYSITYTWEHSAPVSAYDCSTPACVLGYCVLEERFRKLYPGLWELKTLNDMEETCSAIDGMHTSDIWNSIVSPYWPDRLEAYTNYFAVPERKFNHLTQDKLTAKDVVEYLDHLLERL